MPEETHTTITNGEFYQALHAMSKRIDESRETDERMEIKLDQILVQTTKTNGRVTGLEDWREKSNKTFEDIAKLCASLEKKIGRLNSKFNIRTALVVGGGVVLTITGWFALQFIVDSQNKDFQAQQKLEVRQLIKDGIAQALRDSVDKVEVAK